MGMNERAMRNLSIVEQNTLPGKSVVNTCFLDFAACKEQC